MLIIPTWDLMCFLNYTFFPFINLEIHNHENSLSHVLFNPSPTPAPSWTPVSPMSDLLILVSLFVDLSFVFLEKAIAPHSSTLAWKIPWTEEPGRLHSMGSRSDTTERLHFHFSLSCIGEGNGNTLQCSCLENPRDGGAWWAAVYGVTQSQTRLKRFSRLAAFVFSLGYFSVLHIGWIHAILCSSFLIISSLCMFVCVRVLSCDSKGCSPQAPLSMGSSRREYWSGLPCPPPGDLPDPGIETTSLALAGRFFTISATGGGPSLI